MRGYTGRILRIDLTRRRTIDLETSSYLEWVGGHGIGSALFWDLVGDWSIGGFDDRNFMSLMTSPLTGTLVPSGAARVEIQGIGVQAHPTEWFTRSNLGGRFGAMLKFAGWDGIVLEGSSEEPVWLDIRDGEVIFRDASDLWGLDTWETQHALWRTVCGRSAPGRDWYEVAGDRRTTQMPAVLAIGPAGENLCRSACLIHDVSHASGQGGFGAVWGKKKLKAVSVIGTGSVPIADPDALMDAWRAARERYSEWPPEPGARFYNQFSPSEPAFEFWPLKREGRRKACYGCFSGCHATYADGKGSGGKCYPTIMYTFADKARHGKVTDATYHAVDIMNRLGINAYEVGWGLQYIKGLSEMGVLGPGRSIPCDLSFDQYGTGEFIEEYIGMIAERKGIGDDLAEGCVRAADRWGRLKEDSGTGLLRCPYWGYPHHYDPRSHVAWGYGTIVSERDVNEHEINWLSWIPTPTDWIPGTKAGSGPVVPAEEAARIMAGKLAPYDGDPDMLDFSEGNIYSEKMARLVAWHRHFTRFWRQSALYCDFRWSGPINTHAPGKSGILAEGETGFLAAVIGRRISIAEGVELGRRIWNLDNAIWTLQGRHRVQVRFADYIYDTKLEWPHEWYMPGKENGEWKYVPTTGRNLDRDRFEEWKTSYYRLEGWDPDTGWPTRRTLEDLSLAHVADRLKREGKSPSSRVQGGGESLHPIDSI
jgi:aldehyde:ferredoxin oxidoreductase